MPRNLKMTLEYEGTAYHGWQIQPNGVTIQETVESVLERLTQVRPKVIASGRTDAGVHAEGQVAHFHSDTKLSCDELRKGLNALLPHDIVVRKVDAVPEEFHARYSALGKTYRYVILNRPFPSVFERNRCWHIPRPLDVEAMERAAQFLLGRHDFSSFRASDCCAKHPLREIRRLEILQEGAWIRVYLSADAFLKHMVRNIVGTLVEVGWGKMDPAQVREILEGRDRTKAGPTAPAMGLFLESVEYGQGLRRRERLEND